MTWNRPVPTIGDQTSAAQRAEDIDAWAFPEAARDAFYEVLAARRDIRRYRPDPVPSETLERVLQAAHAAPSVGHSQPWRLIVVTEAETRDRAARMADQQRLRQAAQMEPDAGRRLLDLQLEGIREAPLGVVVACDRRAVAAGVLGRATFPDADVWSCACAIENLWLAARAEGLGLGWVTLFDPDELSDLLGLPDGVVTLGWLCLGWPDERPPAPGLERAGWSRRQPLSDVVLYERWDQSPATDTSSTDAAPSGETAPPISRLRAPAGVDVVSARDAADTLLTPPGSLGVLDRCVDRVEAAIAASVEARIEGADRLRSARATPTGALILAAGRHRVVDLGVSAFDPSVTDEVVAASRVGESAGAVAARANGLSFVLEDAGISDGDLASTDALSAERVAELIERGRQVGAAAATDHSVIALGEVGIGNTTVAAVLSAALLGLCAEDVVGLGAGADSAMLERKHAVVGSALTRLRGGEKEANKVVAVEPVRALAGVGGPEFALLAGVVLGAAESGVVCVLDGLATSVAALAAVRMEPGASAYVVAGQRSRERAHHLVLEHLGLEPLLDLRLRAGEGVGAALATGLVLRGIDIRRDTGRTHGAG